MAKNNNTWMVIVVIIVIGFFVIKYNPGLFSIGTDDSNTLYETSSCSQFLSTIKDSGWGYTCTSNCEPIHFIEAKLLWKSENRCINSMDDENSKCKIVYTDGVCK